MRTPQLLDISLWKRSGHWEKFREEMFVTQAENHEYAIKPMNCPCHIEIFKQKLKSYRDLPLRMSEFGSCHRNEPSGALHGLMRVRQFVQDDAHIFCTHEQIQQEVSGFIDLLKEVYMVAEELHKGEKILKQLSPDPLAYLGVYIIGGLLALSIIGLVGGILLVVIVELFRRANKYYVTNQRVIYEFKFLSRRISSTVYNKIQDIHSTQGIIERLFGLGTIHINTAGGRGFEIRFRSVRDPVKVKKLIESHMVKRHR